MGILVAGYALVLSPLLFEVVHVQLAYEGLEGRQHEVLGQHLPKQQLLVLDDHQGALRTPAYDVLAGRFTEDLM